MELTKDTIIYYLIRYYDNPSCKNLDEFYNDLLYFKYTKRLIIKYKNNKKFNLNILLNHIITLYNLFESSEKNSQLFLATRILFFRLEEEYWSILKTILVFLKRLPETFIIIEGRNIDLNSIPLDHNLLKELRRI